MEDETPPKTITGSPGLPTSWQGSAPKPNENQRKLAELIQLGSHYWTPDFTRAQSNALLEDYIEDLADCSVTQLEIACRDWRRNVENKRFPRSAELVRSIFGTPEKPSRLKTWTGHPPIEGPRATKSVYEVLIGAGRTKAAEDWLSWKENKPRG